MPVVAAQPRGFTGTRVAEEIADFSMSKEKALRAVHPPETSLLSFLNSGRAMALLDKIILPLSG